MKIHVKSFAYFRDILGNDLDVDLVQGSTVEDLLRNLICTHRKLRLAIFDDAGEIRANVIFMKNKKNIDYIDGLRTVLTDGDEIAILPPVSGG